MGETMLYGVTKNRGNGNSTLAEAMALRFGLESSVENGITQLLMESDSENLIRALNREAEMEPYVMEVADDIRSLARSIDCSSFSYIQRTANKAAHSLTHIGIELNDVKIWIDEVPNCCNELILNDVRRAYHFLMNGSFSCQKKHRTYDRTVAAALQHRSRRRT
ncbi:hypothetical protein ACS0TY_006969 [Phlomoides rotata]